MLSVERVPNSQLPDAYGGDERRTNEVLQYVSCRFGPVASFSGSYSADRWTLNIQRNVLTAGETVTVSLGSTQLFNVHEKNGGAWYLNHVKVMKKKTLTWADKNCKNYSVIIEYEHKINVQLAWFSPF